MRRREYRRSISTLVLSSLTATTYAAALKSESNLQPVRGLIALLLCLFAFVFWKLDERNRFLIKKRGAGSRSFRKIEFGDTVTKVFFKRAA